LIDVAKGVDAGIAVMLGRVRTKVEDPGTDLTWRPDPSWNLYGAIVKHICYATCGMVGPRATGTEMPVAVPTDIWSADGTDRDSLLALVDTTAAFAHKVIDAMTAAAWDEEIQVNNRTMRRGEVVLNALLHGSQHVGQMLLMDRVRTKSTAGA